MSITPDLTHSIPELTQLPVLLSLIDRKLTKLGGLAWENLALGEEHSLNEDLLFYRDILIQKMNGCGCYNSYPLSKIISKIKQLSA